MYLVVLKKRINVDEALDRFHGFDCGDGVTMLFHRRDNAKAFFNVANVLCACRLVNREGRRVG